MQAAFLPIATDLIPILVERTDMSRKSRNVFLFARVTVTHAHYCGIHSFTSNTKEAQIKST